MNWAEAVVLGASAGLLVMGSKLVIEALINMDTEEEEQFRNHIVEKYGADEEDKWN